VIVGMDFGTTNSGMAVYDGRTVSVLPLDADNANPRILRTALYVTNDQALHIGREALDRYYEQNIGRIVKTRKVWIGEIEVYGGDLYYVTDAYAWVDVSEPGRLLLSIKSRLREPDHPGAVIGQNFYSLEDLIALYLTATRVRAEQLLGREISQVVLGRPVHFSTDEEHDRLAQGRLLQAAFRAGYEKVYLQYEPVAAALSFEQTLTGPENCLIFDFGGGTLDLTVMRLGDPRRREVLATGGLPVAGDIFDQKLTRAKLPAHFGEGSYYGPRHDARPVPRWIYDEFSNWQTFIELQSQENRRTLQEIARTAQRRYQIEALISLVTSNYGLKMFDQVETAKRLLSQKRGAEMRLDGPEFKVRDFVTRSEFERIINAEILAIEKELLRTVAASGLSTADIDAVVRTGGSAQIPAFHEMLARHFGAAKVQSMDTFSSVTAGLGIYAHQISAGEVEARAYSPTDVDRPPQARGSRPRIAPVNLELMQKRILLDAGVATGTTIEVALVMLGEGREVHASALDANQSPDRALQSLELSGQRIVQALVAAVDEPLLLITSVYRFLLLTPRKLLELAEMGLRVDDLYRLEPEETFCVVGSWRAAFAKARLLLVSSRGFARAYPLPILRESIEAPVPLRLDDPLPGLPVAFMGIDDDGDFLVLTRDARGLRWPMLNLAGSGSQVINCGKTDRVLLALPAQEKEVILITEDGYGRRLQPDWVPAAARLNQAGRSLVARKSPLAGAAASPAMAVSTRTFYAIDGAALPYSASTATTSAIPLQDGDHVQAVLTLPKADPARTA